MPNPVSLFRGRFYQKCAAYGVVDITPPTFAGITSATPNTDGSISVAWALASSTKTPIEYHIYIALGSVSAATLFQSANVATPVPAGKTSGRVFLLPDQATYLVKDQQYTIGVRSNDSYGFEDTNTAIQVVTAIASGNFPVVFQSLLDTLDARNTAYGTLNTAHGALNTAQGTNNTTHATNNIAQDSLNNLYDGLNATHSLLNDDQNVHNADYAGNNSTHASLNSSYGGLNTAHGTLNTTQGNNNTTHAANNVAQAAENADHAAKNADLHATQEKLDNAANLVAATVL